MALQHQWDNDSENQANKRTGWMPDMSPQLRRRIRAAAAKRDLSVQKYIEDVLEQTVPQEEESMQEHKRRPVSQESLERLLHTREQIMQDRHGQPFSDSTEIIRQMREEDWPHEEISTSEPEQHEPRPMTKEALEGLLRLREQIKQNHPGQVFDDSTEIIRQMREERSQYHSEL